MIVSLSITNLMSEMLFLSTPKQATKGELMEILLRESSVTIDSS